MDSKKTLEALGFTVVEPDVVMRVIDTPERLAEVIAERRANRTDADIARASGVDEARVARLARDGHGTISDASRVLKAIGAFPATLPDPRRMMP